MDELVNMLISAPKLTRADEDLGGCIAASVAKHCASRRGPGAPHRLAQRARHFVGACIHDPVLIWLQGLRGSPAR